MLLTGIKKDPDWRPRHNQMQTVKTMPHDSQRISSLCSVTHTAIRPVLRRPDFAPVPCNENACCSFHVAASATQALYINTPKRPGASRAVAEAVAAPLTKLRTRCCFCRHSRRPYKHDLSSTIRIGKLRRRCRCRHDTRLQYSHVPPPMY